MATRLIDHNILCDVLVFPAIRAGLFLSLRGIFRRAGRARVRHEAISSVIVPLVPSSSTAARREFAVHAIIFTVDLNATGDRVRWNDATLGARRVLAIIAPPFRDAIRAILQPFFCCHGCKLGDFFFSFASTADIPRGASTTTLL